MDTSGETYSYEPNARYELMIGPPGVEPLRCPMVHTSWGDIRCHDTIRADVELICKSCGRKMVAMCHGCVQWTIDYVAENQACCVEQTESHAVVSIESVTVIECMKS